MKRNLILISFLVLLFDQITKQIAKQFSLRTTGHFLDLTYTTNTGSLFSLFAGSSFINIVFILISIAVIGVLVYLIGDENNSLRKIAYSVILAGIAGNLIDRIFFGSVIDWVNFHFWPIFNVADSAIFVGVAIAIYTLVKEKT